MKKPDRNQQKILEVQQLKETSVGNLQKLLKVFLTDNGLVVAAAAKLAAQWNEPELVEPMQKSFVRLSSGRNSDALCLGKIALMRAWRELDVCDYKTVSLGLTLEQWEPVWGGQEDTAVALRAESAHALTACKDASDHQILCALAERLADAAWPVRAETARALGVFGRPEAAPVLYLKLRAGDAEARVMGECIVSLLILERELAVDTVASYVGAAGVSGEAIFALAAAEFDAALKKLFFLYPKFLPEQQEQALLGLVQNRNGLSQEFILARLQHTNLEEPERKLILRIVKRNGREQLQEKIRAQTLEL